MGEKVAGWLFQGVRWLASLSLSPQINDFTVLAFCPILP